MFDDLLDQNTGFIHWIANKYLPGIQNKYAGAGYEDLEQCVKLAFFRAVGAYDPKRGDSFLYLVRLLSKREIRSLLGLRSEEGRTVSNRPENNAETVSLDEPIPGSEEDTETMRGDLIEDPNAPDPEAVTLRHLINVRVREIVEGLPEPEAELIRLHKLEGLPFLVTAERIGISEKTARNLYRKALDRLWKNQKLKCLLDKYEPLAYKKKSLDAFKSSRSSVVEDAVIQLEGKRGRAGSDRQNFVPSGNSKKQV